MSAFVILGISKFKTVIRLNRFRRISEIVDCTFYKINGAVTTLFAIGINESFS